MVAWGQTLEAVKQSEARWHYRGLTPGSGELKNLSGAKVLSMVKQERIEVRLKGSVETVRLQT